MSTQELGRLFPVIISEYDPQWVSCYVQEKELLEKEFGRNFFLRIEHIGSTAIPGMAAKPTIDIFSIIRESTDIDALTTKFTSLGYAVNKRQDKPSPHLTFVKGYTPTGFQGQAYHVHLRYEGDWDEIHFRDYLVVNSDAASEYEKLKRELSLRYQYDREAYTAAKTDFINKMVIKARKQSNY